MLGWALPIRPGTTPASVYAEAWLTSAASSADEQVDLDPLALAGGVAVAQRGQDPDRGEQPGQHVDQRHAHLLGLAVGRAGDAHQAAERLDQQVIAGQLGAPSPAPKPVIEQ